MDKQSSLAKQKKSDSAQRYEVRWLKTGDAPGQWRTLKFTDSLKEAQDWRDQWRKSSSCADIMIFDRLKGSVVS
jgi:hypothetical protein